MVNDDSIKKWLVLLSVAVLFVLAFLVLKGILVAILTGLLLAYITYPIYKRFNRVLSNKNLCAGFMVLIIVVVIATPIIILAPSLIKQTFDTYGYLQSADLVSPLRTLFPNVINDQVYKVLSTNIDSLIGKFFSTLFTGFTNLILNIPDLLLQFAVFIFVFFFSIRDTEKLVTYVTELSPFSMPTEKKFMSEFRSITNAIIYGQVLIGLLQGLALGIGLVVLGVNNALILSLLTIVASIIPVLGSWIVWLPTSLILVATDKTFAGVALFLYGALIVSSIDNIVRPLLISQKSHLSVVLSIVGIIGGMYYFGLAGIVLGPLILAYVMIVIDFYRNGKLDELFRKNYKPNSS